MQACAGICHLCEHALGNAQMKARHAAAAEGATHHTPDLKQSAKNSLRVQMRNLALAEKQAHVLAAQESSQRLHQLQHEVVLTCDLMQHAAPAEHSPVCRFATCSRACDGWLAGRVALVHT